MLIFNPAYRLVNDLDRILLLGTTNGKYNGSQRYYIHPDIAVCNEDRFKERAVCSANLDGIIILPDGKVTICEELYWHSSFVIGDLTKQSIMEVWNSDKATGLWNIGKEEMPEYSACRNCEDIHRCRQGQGVCWKMVLQAYGMDKEFMPDPRCPMAPAPFDDYFLNQE